MGSLLKGSGIRHQSRASGCDPDPLHGAVGDDGPEHQVHDGEDRPQAEAPEVHDEATCQHHHRGPHRGERAQDEAQPTQTRSEIVEHAPRETLAPRHYVTGTRDDCGTFGC